MLKMGGQPHEKKSVPRSCHPSLIHQISQARWTIVSVSTGLPFADTALEQLGTFCLGLEGSNKSHIEGTSEARVPPSPSRTSMMMIMLNGVGTSDVHDVAPRTMRTAESLQVACVR